MHRLILFGGTTEGRALCAFCVAEHIPALYCVATADGADAAAGLTGIEVRVGRLDADGMAALFAQEAPEIVVDATHPYAVEASRNIVLACQQIGIRLIRVARESADEPGGCVYVDGADALLAFLADAPGNVFATTGASSAAVLARLPDFQNRVFLRILPSLDSLKTCLDAGFHPNRLICMQGPFSTALNRAMFEAVDARILVTKESGAAGGFPEKLAAALVLGMTVVVLTKPAETGGVTLAVACDLVKELTK